MTPRETLLQFDEFLAARGLSFQAVVVGGAALALLGVVSRQTKDCDVLAPELPDEIDAAARDFARGRLQLGDFLDEDWFNNGPASLAPLLPDGWRTRLQPVFSGRALTLYSLGRVELLMSKLFALCDRGLDLADCLALGPTVEELQQVRLWLERQDSNPDWPAHVGATLADLGRRLGHAI